MIQARKGIGRERWLPARDFNDIVSNEKNYGGNWGGQRIFKAFKDFINENQLMDIGF